MSGKYFGVNVQVIDSRHRSIYVVIRVFGSNRREAKADAEIIALRDRRWAVDAIALDCEPDEDQDEK